MEYVRIEFGKDKTLIIKGIAIIFMIVLHVFGGANWYDIDIPMNSNTGLLRWVGSTVVCVPVYLFMVGYGYSFSKKDLSYSCKHIKHLLCIFWFIFFCFVIPASIDFIQNSQEILLNMFGLSESLCWVSWFVYVYIWALLIMPFVGRVIDKRPLLSSFVFICLFYICEVLVHEFLPLQNWTTHALITCFSVTPTIILGYYCSRKNLFQQIKLPNRNSIALLSFLGLFIVLAMKVLLPDSILGFGTGFFLAPLLIMCILSFFTIFKNRVLERVFMELGDKSVYMWFVHALFFTPATRHIYGSFVTISNNLWIIALWTIIFSYVVSVVLKKIMEY